ncbi:MAG: hypothetical protein AVDCRST_MAG48-3144, partial [uncultured Friedmanniella sp.]
GPHHADHLPAPQRAAAVRARRRGHRQPRCVRRRRAAAARRRRRPAARCRAGHLHGDEHADRADARHRGVRPAAGGRRGGADPHLGQHPGRRREQRAAAGALRRPRQERRSV